MIIGKFAISWNRALGLADEENRRGDVESIGNVGVSVVLDGNTRLD